VSGHQGKEGERPKILKQQSTFWSKTNKEERRRRHGGAFSSAAISRDGLYVKKSNDQPNDDLDFKSGTILALERFLLTVAS
jgi:hypothetical protein